MRTKQIGRSNPGNVLNTMAESQYASSSPTFRTNATHTIKSTNVSTLLFPERRGHHSVPLAAAQPPPPPGRNATSSWGCCCRYCPRTPSSSSGDAAVSNCSKARSQSPAAPGDRAGAWGEGLGTLLPWVANRPSHFFQPPLPGVGHPPTPQNPAKNRPKLLEIL